MNSWLMIDGKTYSHQQIMTGTLAATSEFADAVLAFCRRWLGGQSTFTIQTSGSTGTPKEITFNRSQLEVSARSTENALDLQQGFTAMLCLDPRYIAGQMMLVRSFVTGMNVIAVPPTADPLEGMDSNIDFIALVPYQLEAILQRPKSRQKLEKIKCTIIGGAMVSETLKQSLQEISSPVYATYGMTETISHIALQRMNGLEQVDTFQVLPGISVDVTERGCLRIEAAHLDGPVTTNDLVKLVDSGKFIWLGRSDHVINSGGIKIIPEEVERIIEQEFSKREWTNRFFVTGLPDEKLGNRVVLLIEGTPWPTDQCREILTAIREASGSPYSLPREIKFISAFVETSTNKINRRVTVSKL
jgi:o-succinylbenzoate---CoA ligase